MNFFFSFVDLACKIYHSHPKTQVSYSLMKEPNQGLQYYASYVIKGRSTERGMCLTRSSYTSDIPGRHATYVDIDNYNFPAETLCSIEIDFMPLDP